MIQRERQQNDSLGYGYRHTTAPTACRSSSRLRSPLLLESSSRVFRCANIAAGAAGAAPCCCCSAPPTPCTLVVLVLVLVLLAPPPAPPPAPALLLLLPPAPPSQSASCAAAESQAPRLGCPRRGRRAADGHRTRARRTPSPRSPHNSRRRDCRFDGTPFLSVLQRLYMEGGAAEWQSRRRLPHKSDVSATVSVAVSATIVSISRTRPTADSRPWDLRHVVDAGFMDEHWRP